MRMDRPIIDRLAANYCCHIHSGPYDPTAALPSMEIWVSYNGGERAMQLPATDTVRGTNIFKTWTVGQWLEVFEHLCQWGYSISDRALAAELWRWITHENRQWWD